jgi:hypothetical protein
MVLLEGRRVLSLVAHNVHLHKHISYLQKRNPLQEQDGRPVDCNSPCFMHLLQVAVLCRTVIDCSMTLLIVAARPCFLCNALSFVMHPQKRPAWAGLNLLGRPISILECKALRQGVIVQGPDRICEHAHLSMLTRCRQRI